MSKSIILRISAVLVLVGIMLLLFTGMQSAIGQSDENAPLNVQDLRDYDHDLHTKEGGIVDIHNMISNLSGKAQRQRNQHNSLEIRVNDMEREIKELRRKLNMKTEEPKKEEPKTVSIISNEGGQVVSYTYGKHNLVKLGFSESVADDIISACNTARNHSHCVESFVGVSNAESSMFKNCSTENCMGLMKNGKLMRFENQKAKIDNWVGRYNKYRRKRETTESRLTVSRYCTSGCENRVKNFDYAVSLLRTTL